MWSLLLELFCFQIQTPVLYLFGFFCLKVKEGGALGVVLRNCVCVTCSLRRPHLCLWCFPRSGPEARPGGGAVHGHQVHQRRVSERPGAGGQWLSRRGHGPQSSATLPLLATGTLPEVRNLSPTAWRMFTRFLWKSDSVLNNSCHWKDN